MKRNDLVKLNIIFALAAAIAVFVLSSVICRHCIAVSAAMVENTEIAFIRNLNPDAKIDCEDPAEDHAVNLTYQCDAKEPEAEQEEAGIANDLGLSDSDMSALKQIAMAEAEGEGAEGKALVMMVVLNRKKTAGFPGTVEGVILQERNGTHQFSVTGRSGRYWWVNPDQECEEALDMILNGWDGSRGALYFESCSDPNNWHSRNLEFLFQYGAHRFYK